MMERIDGLKGIRVLVVEDDSDTRQILTFIFEQSGAAVVAAGSFDEAVKLYQEIEPSVLITDIAMPDFNGYALVTRIREEDGEVG